MSGPAALVVPAIKRHTATVIVAHGLGDSYVTLQLCMELAIANTPCLEGLDGTMQSLFRLLDI